jgi:hypothetical protein
MYRHKLGQVYRIPDDIVNEIIKIIAMKLQVESVGKII